MLMVPNHSLLLKKAILTLKKIRKTLFKIIAIEVTTTAVEQRLYSTQNATNTAGD